MLKLGIVMMVIATVISIAGIVNVSHVKSNTRRIEAAQRRLEQVQHRLALVQDRLDSAERRTCQRVQRLRDQVNSNSKTIFLTLDQAARNPQVPPAIRAAYRDFTDRVDYQPPTNCRMAVLFPNVYRPPAAVPMRDWLRTHP